MYSDHSTPSPAPLPGRSVQPAPNQPGPGKPTPDGATGKILTVLQLTSLLHGPDEAQCCMHYAANLANAIRLEREVTEAGAADDGSWLHLQEEIRSAATSYLNAADMVLQLCGMKSGLINSGLVNTVPAPILARIIAAGLECMADDMLDLIESLPSKGPEEEGGPDA